MIFVLATDAHLAREWAGNRGLAEEAWSVATADGLKALPEGENADKTLIILEGAEQSPDYLLILELAKDRGVAIEAAG